MAHERSLLVDGIYFGEGPRWHDGRLWFSDIAGKTVYACDEGGKLEKIVEVDGAPSGLGWDREGRLLIVSMHDHRLLRFDGGALSEVADLSQYCGGHMNDMVVDLKGRAWIGNIGFDMTADPMQPAPTNIARVDPDGSHHLATTDLMAPNGMVVTPDGKTLIVGESGGYRLLAYDIAADGELSGRRVYARLPEGATPGATPDGICLDAEGAVWCASPTTCEFLRMREGGEVADRIALGDRHAIACMLGGADRRTLYLVSAATMSIAQAKSLGRTGHIEQVRVDVPGAGCP